MKKDLYEEISLETCVKKRVSEGGPGPDSVKEQLRYVACFLEKPEGLS